MAALRKTCQYVFFFLAVFVWMIGANTPTGFFRETCNYRKGSLIQPVGEYTRRLSQVREQMLIRASLQGPEIHGYLLPSFDEHLNHEVSPRDQRLYYLTGFTGIKAVAVITQKRAALWVENRYVLQADGELDCDWEIFPSNHTTTIAEWLDFQLYADQRVGADPRIAPHHLWIHWERELRNRDLELQKINHNLIDLIWRDRPHPNRMPIQVQERIYAGQRWEEKVTELRQHLSAKRCDAMIVTSLTEIAYLLNIRGRDIPYTPVVKSYLIVTLKDVYFYVDRYKVHLDLDLHLHTDCFSEFCVKIRDYHQIWNDIRTYVQVWRQVLIPGPCVQEPGASEAIFSAVPVRKILEEESPIIFMRAQKNSEEQKGMRVAHIRDGAAICEALSNLESRFSTEEWTEEKIKFEIERSRLSQKHAKGLSLRTVVAFGPHSAIPYYLSSNVTDIEVTDKSLLVLESGGQYFEGTTDVVRTVMFGEPTAAMKQAYTNVLAGILKLSTLKFPADLEPSKVDALVRSPVWDAMIDFPQTTGHGIGSFGAVEEPPIIVAYGVNSSHLFKQGYFFSSEAGFYNQGKFGARLKNVLEVVDTGRTHTSGVKFLAFQDVTLVPYEPKLIEGSLLSAVEKRQLNDYNTNIRNYIGEELKRQGNAQAFYWMMNKTRHIREYLPLEEYRAAMGGGGTNTQTKIYFLSLVILICNYIVL